MAKKKQNKTEQLLEEILRELRKQKPPVIVPAPPIHVHPVMPRPWDDQGPWMPVPRNPWPTLPPYRHEVWMISSGSTNSGTFSLAKWNGGGH